METAVKLAAGIIAGGLVGFGLSRAKVCTSTACKARVNVVYSIISGAVLGAAVAWWAIRR